MLKQIVSKYWQKQLTFILPQTLTHSINRDIHFKHKYNMNEAFLRYITGNERFDFSFRYIDKDLNIDRQINLSRLKSESVEVFLQRIEASLSKIINKIIKRRSKKSMEANIKKEIFDTVEHKNITLMKDDCLIELDESCSKLLENPLQLSMTVLGVPYIIKFNAPWIIKIKLPKSLMSGFPVYPVELESLFMDTNKSEFTWFRNERVNNQMIWLKIGDKYIYTPNNGDIGSKLKLICLPRNDKNDGPAIEIESTSVVEAGPGMCPFDLRHSYTQTKLSGNNFRIVSYNILADSYADSTYSREVLYPYCPPYALAIDYRKLLIIKELIGYNSDIICLQEVDKKIYKNDMEFTFGALNYDSVYSTKGDISEGLAIIYNKMRFELINTISAIMSETIDSNGLFKCVWDKITNENARKRYLDRNTSVLVVTLHSLEKIDQILVVGNTHLYFHPDADHIRLLQAYHALTFCQKIADEVREKYPDKNVTLMLCGDFNSTPIDGVYELITKNTISEDHKDWSSNIEQKVENVSLSHNLSLASACGTPEYTNFTLEFADCLDYIFYESNKLSVSQIIPLPTKNQLTLNSAIPSVLFPSDHIAICADMKWN